MSLINWIFDIYQHRKIDRAHEEARAAREELAQVRASGGGLQSERVEQALGEIALGVKALQRMLVSKGICNASEFAQLLDEIDREDGKADGRSPY